MSDVLDTLREYAKDWRDRAGDVDPVHKAISEIKRLRSQLAEQYPAGQSEALRSAIAAINVDDEGHPEGNLQYVLIRGFSTLGWSQPTNASNDAIDAILALLPAGSPSPGVTARPTEAADASLLLSEIVTHFAKTDEQPSDWAHTDDHSEFCLDHQSPDKTKFWLDLKTNGEIAVLWKPAGAPKPRTMSFVQKSAAHPTVKVSGDGEPDEYFRDDPMFNKGVLHAQDILNKLIGNPDYVASDGSEDYDTDLGDTILNQLEAAGLYDKEDGRFATFARSAEMSAAEMREACLRAAEQVGNFGDYKREELTTDYGQPRFDMMNAIIEAIRAIPTTAVTEGDGA